MRRIGKTLTPIAIAWASSLSLGIAGCGDYDPQGEGARVADPTIGAEREGSGAGQDVTESKASNLWVVSSSVWDLPTIPVCWENPTAADANQRAWVKIALEQTWESVSRVDFTGWGTCPATGGGVRILISDQQPRTLRKGKGLNNLQSGVILNFSYQTWQQACRIPAQNGQPARINENCVRVDAIHEFGHVLGFGEETDRFAHSPQIPASCTLRRSIEEFGYFNLDGYDPDSVMNLCNPRYVNRAAVTTPNPTFVLSSNDVRGVQQVYGGLPGMFLGFWGRCLDVSGSATTPGSRLVTADCSRRNEQRWFPSWATEPGNPYTNGSIASLAPGSTLKVDLPSNNQTLGTQLQLWSPNTTTAQMWRMGRAADMTFRGHVGRCMDVRANGTANGTPVQMWDCPPFNPANDAQLWRRDTQGRIVAKNGKCLDVPPGNVPNGTGVQIFDCHNGTNQIWDFQSPGKLVSRSSGKCLDANVFTFSGVQLQVWDCRGSTNQHWMVRGRVTNPEGRCMNVRNLVNAPGTPVETNACKPGEGINAEAQLWDYHW